MVHSTIALKNAINRLLRLNDYTAGAEVRELYLGTDIMVVTFSRPIVIEGACRDVEQTIDLFDLMNMHEEEANERAAR